MMFLSIALAKGAKSMGYLKPAVSYVFNREYSEKEIERITVVLNELYKVKRDISDRVATLNKKSSKIACELLEESEKEFAKANEAYEAALSRYGASEKVEEEKKSDPNICSKEEEEYIKKQANRLVYDFLEYIAANMIEIAGRIETSFMFLNVHTYYSEGRKDVCRANSGIFGVYDCSTGECITKTTDFNFPWQLYTPKRSEYTDELYTVSTPWFTSFFERFVTIFNSTLREKFTYRDTFSLEFDENSIVLTLK